MRRTGTFLKVVLVVVFGLSLPLRGQLNRPWWVSLELGAGQLKLISNQRSSNGLTTFAMGFSGGRRLAPWARAGVHLNGWLLQAANLNDPTVGEAVSNFNGILDVFPIVKRGLFLRGGGGVSMYSNNQPLASDGHGLGWEAGAGYELPLPKGVRISPIVEYASGGLGNAFAPSIPGTAPTYSILEFKAAIIYPFGRTRK